MSRIETDWPALFREHPDANDVEMAAILGCTPQTVKAHRCVLGLPRRYGRPSPVATAKPVQVWTRCTAEEKATMEGYAAARGQTVSDWIRDACREHIGRMVRIGVPERMEAVQARMGVVLDRAHEASGVVVKR